MDARNLTEKVFHKSLEWYTESSKKLDNLFIENNCSNLFDLSLLAIEEMERKAFYREVKEMTFEEAKERTAKVLKRYSKYWVLDQHRNRKPRIDVRDVNMIEKHAEASRIDVAVKYQNWLKAIEEAETVQGDLFNITDEEFTYMPYPRLWEESKKNF